MTWGPPFERMQPSSLVVLDPLSKSSSTDAEATTSSTLAVTGVATASYYVPTIKQFLGSQIERQTASLQNNIDHNPNISQQNDVLQSVLLMSPQLL